MKKLKISFGYRIQTIGFILGGIPSLASIGLFIEGIVGNSIFILYAIISIMSGITIMSLFYGFGELIQTTEDIKTLLIKLHKNNKQE